MAVLIHYRLTDGAIQRAWQAATDALLALQGGPPQDGMAALVVDTAIPLARLATEAYVADGAVQPKTVLTLTASQSPFAADGITVCRVSVDPFVPCTLLVDGTPYTLNPEDMVVELTSDVPHTFMIMLAPMTRALADPLTVEASSHASS